MYLTATKTSTIQTMDHLDGEMENIPTYFKNSAEALRFFDELDGYDSGVDELPFSNYVTLENSQSSDQCFDYCNIKNTNSIIDGDDDELGYIDDDKDVDYKPSRSCTIKKSHSKLKRRQYPNTGNRTIVEHHLVTPEKQIMSRTGIGSQLSIRQYNRKDRTPNTIRKMMERHRENERVRHHSLNESLKDVSMRVPGYDPNSKETKIVQMQRIIGYECFLENTLRNLCQQLDVSPKLILKGNTQFISDSLENIPFEDFYMSRMCRIEDLNDELHMTTLSKSDDLPPGCRIIKSANIEENILKYRREKISSPTVDSTTDNFIQLVPIMPVRTRIKLENHSQNDSKTDGNCDWLPESGFKPIGSSQDFSASQESGIKIETESSMDEFNEIGSLIQDSLYDECEQLRTVTPSFMKEEPVTISTTTDEADESFDFSSPVRYKDTVFLQSPPGMGIWHSAGKSNIYEWRDTSLQMESVSPENILETRPKSSHVAECEDTINSTIKPMSSILKSSDDKNQIPTKSGKYNNHAELPDYNLTGLHEEKENFIHSPSNMYYPACSIFSSRRNSIQSPHYKQDTKSLKYASNMPPNIPTVTTSLPYAKLINRGRVIKTAPVKINIINGNSSHRNKCFEGHQTNHDICQSVPNIAISSSNFGNHSRPPVYRSSNRVLTSGMRSITVPVIPSCSDMKNKRKRYTPFRSSVSNLNHFEETRDVHYPGQVKKMRTCDSDDALIGFPRTEQEIKSSYSRDQTQVGGHTRESQTQHGVSTPDSSTNMEHFTVVPEVISVKPENLYFF